MIILTRGANMGMKALYFVAAILFTSLLFFFLGKSTVPDQQFVFNAQIRNPDGFFFVFTIIFPAFTGLVAGLGLSGDLRDPSRSIPRGTLWATFGGFVVYILVAYKLAVSASPDALASDQLIMEKIAQVIQLSGISGKGNNMILFEFSQSNPGAVEEALNTHDILFATGFDLCILNTSYRGFGYKKQIHIWITAADYDNANLMILLGYIILGHPEWKKAIIKIFAIYQSEEAEVKKEELKTEGYKLYTGYDQLGNVLFVSANKKKEIK